MGVDMCSSAHHDRRAYRLLRPLVSATLAVLFFVMLPTTAPGATTVELEVARLDTLHSLSDPLVGELAALGEPAIPYLANKVLSTRRATCLGATRALSRMKNTAAVRPLLERWAGTTDGEPREQVVRAINAVLRGLSESAVEPGYGVVDEELELLGRSVLCDENGLPVGCDIADRGESDDALLVYGEGLSDAYDLGCEGRKVHVFPSEAFRETEHLVGRAFVRLDLAAHELPQPPSDMPRWVDTIGTRPTRVALVRVACGRVGPGEPVNEYGVLWVKSTGSWSPLMQLYHMSTQ
jgi:hypothetical protein